MSRMAISFTQLIVRGVWWKVGLLFVCVTALIELAIFIHENRVSFYYKVCHLDTWNYQSLSVRINQSDKLEFPRLFPAPRCEPKINTSVPADVCRNLHQISGESNRQAFMRLFKYFDEMATKYKWTYFITYGTLWGSWRHHDVIPWDHDTDIFVEYKDRMDLVDKIETFQDRFVPKQCTHHKIHLYDRHYITGSTFLQDVGRWYDPSIDMFFFTRNQTHFMRSDYPTADVFKLEDIFPLHRRPLGTLMLPAPRDTLKFLNRYYKSTDVCAAEGSAKCRDFKPYLPFVHRKWRDGKMEERLMLNGKLLQVKYLDEMQENIAFDPYTLASSRFPAEKPLFF